MRLMEMKHGNRFPFSLKHSLALYNYAIVTCTTILYDVWWKWNAMDGQFPYWLVISCISYIFHILCWQR